MLPNMRSRDMVKKTSQVQEASSPQQRGAQAPTKSEREGQRRREERRVLVEMVVEGGS